MSGEVEGDAPMGRIDSLAQFMLASLLQCFRLGSTSKSTLENHMVNPVMRSVVLVTGLAHSLLGARFLAGPGYH